MKYSYKHIILFFIIVIVIILFNILFNSFIKKNKSLFSGFQNYTTKWSPDLIRRFNLYQLTMNDNVNQFNLDQLQKQASPEEVEEYLKTGYWYWPDDLKQLYIEKVWSNPIIKIDPHYALNYAMSLYNQTAVRELLAWNTKEGQFLLYGVDLGYTKDEMPQIHPNQNKHNTIKCSGNSVDTSHMEKTVYNGANLWNGFINSTTTVLKPEDIPKEVPGFSFVKGPCNPCSALNFDGNFNCPFRIKVGNDDDSISEPWKQLWNL
jgi:hypothetical protein